MGAGRGKGRGSGGDGCCGMSGGMCVVAVIAFIILLVTAIVLIAVSIKSIETNEIALDYDGFNMKINDKMYEGGTYFLGLGHSFIAYPKTQQTIKFTSPVISAGRLNAAITVSGANGPAVACRSKDGLPIWVNCDFNYRLKLTFVDIERLYLLYGEIDEVNDLYVRIARNVVRTAASKYASAAFFNETRATIEDDMEAQLRLELESEGAVVESFQLMELGAIPAFTEVRARQQAAEQEVSRANADLQVTRINAGARVNAARQEASLIVSQARINSQQDVLVNQAKISAMQARYAAEGSSYALLQQTLNMTAEELLSLIWLDAQSEGFSSNKVRTLINMPFPSVGDITA